MGLSTSFLKLLKPAENDYYNSQTEQAENWQKVDDWAKKTKDEIDNRTKIATHSELGRIKVGENLTISEDGTLDIQICTPQEMVVLVEKYKVKE